MKTDSDDEAAVAIEAVVSTEEDNFSRFTSFQKRLYLVIVSLACFLSPISSTMFLPAVPDIAKALHSSEKVITSSNAIYCVFMAISSFLSSSMSNNYGRKWTTVVCAGVYTVAGIVVSQSRNVAMFFVFRAIMALFGTAFFSIGAIIIRDIFRPQERGRAMGILLVGSQAGLAIAAVIGGVLTEYTHWQVIFYLLTGLGGFVFVLALVCLKETGENVLLLEYQRQTGKKLKWFPINWSGPFKIMKCVPVVFTTYSCCTLLYSIFALLTPISYVIKRQLHIDSVVLSSLFYLAPGSGLLLGSLIGDKYSDYMVLKYTTKRGKRVAEDRLRASLAFFAGLGPAALIAYGWCLDKKVGGIAAPVVFMFLVGLSQCMAFPSVNSYVLDAMPLKLVGVAVANSYIFRFLFGALASGTILPQIDSIGVGWTCTISAFILWSGASASVLVIMYGEKWRVTLMEETRVEKGTGT